jgi:hypothetical protein
MAIENSLSPISATLNQASRPLLPTWARVAQDFPGRASEVGQAGTGPRADLCGGVRACRPAEPPDSFDEDEHSDGQRGTEQHRWPPEQDIVVLT